MNEKIFLQILIAFSVIIFAVGTISVSAKTDGIYTYTVSNGKTTITECSTSASGETVIPDTLGGYPVTSIDGHAFSNCNLITSITIPNSVTSIGEYAFGSCSSLTDVYYDGTDTEWNLISIASYNSPLTTATIHFMPNTRTTLSNNDKTFTITPINIQNGKTVILSLYNGDVFVEMQKAVYTGEAIPFTTTKAYTKAKVMVWDDLISLKPVCEPEIVK